MTDAEVTVATMPSGDAAYRALGVVAWSVALAPKVQVTWGTWTVYRGDKRTKVKVGRDERR
jgi:hypothetical protein